MLLVSPLAGSALAATVPGAPTIGVAVAGFQTATVSWTAPVSDGGAPVTGYVVTPYVGYFPLPSVTMGFPGTSRTFTGLTNGTIYRFRVRAINSAGTGGYSNASNPVTPTVTVPGAPRVDTIVGGNGEVTVYLRAPVSDGGSPVTGYVVTPYIGYYPLPSQTFAPTATTQVVTGLTNGTTYRFRVQATNSVGTGPYSTANGSVHPVDPITDVTDVTAGAYHTCALGSGGAIQCWGYNGYGQLGNGWAGYSTPVTVTGISDATAVTAGAFHTCALVSGGAVKCWGYGASGQLGNGTITDSSIPVTVTGISDATAVTVGEYHTCAVVSAGAVKCWGNNTSFQLANGTITNSSLPTPVLGS